MFTRRHSNGQPAPFFIPNVIPELIDSGQLIQPRNGPSQNNCFQFTLALLLRKFLHEIGQLDEAFSVRNNRIEAFSDVAVWLWWAIQGAQRSDVNAEIEVKAAAPLRSLDVEDMDQLWRRAVPCRTGLLESGGLESRCEPSLQKFVFWGGHGYRLRPRVSSKKGALASQRLAHPFITSCSLTCWAMTATQSPCWVRQGARMVMRKPLDWATSGSGARSGRSRWWM